ncbi:MAG: MoxR family ATPase, partial [Candidatus Lokiarchaeota archaeon]|nr:MoxR family ATPase [Candidatus Lokiarchaeota archaeon]
MEADKAKYYEHEEIDITPIREIAQEVLSEVSRVIVGYGDILQQLFISLLVNGHVLLEGVPGLGKTVMAKTFAKTLGITFRRVQFTPDLLPADITGTKIFSQEEGTFVLQKGPIFANVVLADEINRSAPKTQAALLEAMAERQVTIEGDTLKLEKPFIVIATENPVEMEGTYPLPEAQIDRFLLKIWLDYPEQDEEVDIMRRQISGESPSVDKITNAEEILAAQRLVNMVYIDDRILKYIRDIILKTRNHPQIALGCSPRAGLTLMKCGKARAAILGRTYVTPDDVRALTVPALNHRI